MTEIFITTANRESQCLELMKELKGNKGEFNVRVFHDFLGNYQRVKDFCEKHNNFYYYKTKANFGRLDFWKLNNLMYKLLSSLQYETYIQIPDDIKIVKDFVQRATALVSDDFPVVNFFSLILYNRLSEPQTINGVEMWRQCFADCSFVALRSAMKGLYLKECSPIDCSGVGDAFNKAYGKEIPLTKWALCEHFGDESVMMPEKQRVLRCNLLPADRAYIYQEQKPEYYVTVIMNCYNELEHLFRRSVESVLKNDVKIQLIVSTVKDDPCTKWAKDYPVTLVVNEKAGIYSQLNAACKYIKGDYVTYCSSNDYMYDFKLREEIEILEAKNKRVCYSGYTRIENGTHKEIFQDYNYEDHLKNNFVSDCAMVEAGIFKKYLPFKEELGNMAYYDFWLRIFEGEGNVFLSHKNETWVYDVTERSQSIQRKKDPAKIKHNEKLRELTLKDRIKRIEELKKNPLIFAAIPVKGRRELLPLTIRRLLKSVHTVYCIGDNREDKKVCEKAGATWVEHPNEPLAEKWNAGIIAAIKSGIPFAGFLFMGSSDWVCENWVPAMIPYLQDYDMVGKLGCTFVDVDDQNKIETTHWGGYLNERKGEPIGIGRMYSMNILKKLNGALFGHGFNSGLDYYSMLRVQDHGGKYKIIENNNIHSVSVSTNKWINKHDFNWSKTQLNSTNLSRHDSEVWCNKHFPEAQELAEKIAVRKRVKQLYCSSSTESFKSLLQKKYKLTEFTDASQPVMMFGLYNEIDYKMAMFIPSKKIIVWCGSDSMEISNDVYKITNVKHIAISKQVSDDLTEKGITHELVPVCPANIDNWKYCPKGDAIYFYTGTSKKIKSIATQQFYGSDYLADISKKTGLKIIKVYSDSYTPEQLKQVYEKCFIGVRLTPHDGLPNTVIELGLMGRKVIHNGGLPNSIPWQDIDDICENIMKEYKNRNQDSSELSKQVREYLNTTDFLTI